MGMRPWRATFIALMGAAWAITAMAQEQAADLWPAWQHVAGPDERVYSLDAREGIGALARTSSLLAGYAPDGTRRWQLGACASCIPWTTGYAMWRLAILRTDGGAWAIRSVQNGSGAASRSSLYAVRIGPDGRVRGETLLDDDFFDGVLGNVDDADGFAVVLDVLPTDTPTIDYVRFDRDGAEVGRGAYAGWSRGNRLRDSRVLSDGDMVVELGENDLCFLGCDLPRTGILRIRPAGTLAWRYDFEPHVLPTVALDTRGGASALITRLDGIAAVRSITPDGIAHDETIAQGFVDASFYGLAPRIGGRQLVMYAERNVSTTRLGLMDRRSHLSAQRDIPYSWPYPAPTAFGYIGSGLGDATADAELLSPSTLATMARFHFEGDVAPDPNAGSAWHILDSGIVYGAGAVTRDDGSRQLVVARFDLPILDRSACAPVRASPGTPTPRSGTAASSTCTPARPIRVTGTLPAGVRER